MRPVYQCFECFKVLKSFRPISSESARSIFEVGILLLFDAVAEVIGKLGIAPLLRGPEPSLVGTSS